MIMNPIVNPKSKILPSVVLLSRKASEGRRMGVNPKSSVFQSSIVNLQYSIIVLAAFFMLFMAFPVFSMAGTVSLPQTGQTTCYNEYDAIIDCAGTGQDGDIQAGVAWPDPRFTDNGDGTVTDNLTGLMWAQDANLINTESQSFDNDDTAGDGEVTWQHALDYVAGMNAGTYSNFGHTDWRLPNVNELESLYNAEESNIYTWLNGQGFTNVQFFYWSSTSDARNTYSAWYSFFISGSLSRTDKTNDNYHSVWPVRSLQNGDEQTGSVWQTGQTTCYDEDGNVIDCTDTGQDGDIQAGVAWLDPRFTDNGDSTVTDNLTGLMWAQDANLINTESQSFDNDDTAGDGEVTWQHALDYVAGMNAGTYSNFGYTDWRLPNYKELFSLIDRSQYYPALPSGHPFTNVQSPYYWSSTSSAYDADNAYCVYMYGGMVSAYPEKDSSYYYAWSVRSGSGGTLDNSDISVSPASHDFGNVTVDDTSTAHSFTVSNNGDADLVIDTISLTGTDLSAFSIQNDSCSGQTVAASGSCNVEAVFSPTVETAASANLSIPSNDPDTPTLDVPLSGTGTGVGVCTYSLYSTSATFNSDGGTDTVSVTPSNNDCTWTAISNNNNWITITSGSSGIGDGEVTYSIYENTKTTSRTGTITIAGGTFTVTQEGNDTLDDNIAPSVTIVSPVDGSTTDLVYFIHGTSSDDSPSSGIDRVEIQVSYGSGNYLELDGNWSTTEQWITTSGTEAWFYDASNVSWEDGVEYEVTANVYDNEEYMGASTNTFTFQEADPDAQFYSILSLELSSQTILQNETIDASGKLTRLPDNGTDLSGETITLTITEPDGSSATETTETYDSYGHYLVEEITGFTQKGTYTILASFDETDALTASKSDTLSVLVGTSAGYAIIVQGKISSEEGLESHNKTANRVYDTLLARGFVDNNIYYFNYDTSQTGVDAYPTSADIQNTIASWPMEKMNGSPAPLYIILHDHGNTDTFYLDDETITPDDLDSWLDTLESGLNTGAILEKRIIIYGACYSGSFISALSKPATDTDGGRVVITSAAEDEESYKGTLEPDGIRSGSYFLEEFFNELERGYSIKESFESATDKTETYTRTGDSSANTNNAYFDSSEQHPLLDDDGDGTGSNALSDGTGDGQIAADLYLGTGVTFDTNSATNPAEIIYVTDTVHLDHTTSTYLMWATANDSSDVSSAWMEIRLPSQTLSESGGTEQLSTDYTKELMSLNESTDNWEKQIDTFTESGMYEIYYYVKDDETLEISPTKRSVVYKDETGNNPPGMFDLSSPEYGSEQKTVLIFEWESSTDPDGDNITYNLLIATDEDSNDIVYRKEEITTTAAIVDAGAGLFDLTTYYWKVQAIDAYGLTMDSAETWPFYTNNTNFGFGFITGIVYDARTFAPIVGATVKTDFADKDTTKTEGYYIMSANEGAYTVTCSFDGYPDTSFSGISVSDGKTTELNIPMTSSVTGTGPAPDIKANGSDNTVTIGTSETLTIIVSLSAGDSGGVKCDWWVAESASDGWYYLDAMTMSWLYAGGSYTALSATYKGALFDLGPYNVLNTPRLSEGTHTFYFAIDTNMDGILDLDQIYYDSVVVNVE